MFVSGAHGDLGTRIVRELLAQGYRVRAGVRSTDKPEVSGVLGGRERPFSPPSSCHPTTAGRRAQTAQCAASWLGEPPRTSRATLAH